MSTDEALPERRIRFASTATCPVPNYAEEDGDPFFYCDDCAMFPPRGVMFTIQLSIPESQALLHSRRVAFPDCASWRIPDLGIEVGPRQHAGFKGTVAELLEKAERDIEMMRGGYPKAVQAKFDAFLSRCTRLRFGGEMGEKAPVSSEPNARNVVELIVRDPSGLSFVQFRGTELIDGDDDDDEPVLQRRPKWVVRRRYFHRSFQEESDLGLIDSIATANLSHAGPPGSIAATPHAIAELVARCGKVTVLSGAGISAESSIPTFRDAAAEAGASVPTVASGGAIWRNFDASKMTLQNFHIKAFEDDAIDIADDVPTQWWRLKRTLVSKVQAASPNPAHLFFAHLESAGLLESIITQNIDSLHTRAIEEVRRLRGQVGSAPPPKVLELHGHMRGVICSNKPTPLNPVPYNHFDRARAMAACEDVAAAIPAFSATDGVLDVCDFSLNEEEATPLLDPALNEAFPPVVPRCPRCAAKLEQGYATINAPGIRRLLAPPLRTETVFFGQPLPDGIVGAAQDAIARSGVLMVIGSSLIVSPACDLPLIAMRLGIPLVIINRDETAYDQFAQCVIREPAGAFLAQVLEILKEKGVVA